MSDDLENDLSSILSFDSSGKFSPKNANEISIVSPLSKDYTMKSSESASSNTSIVTSSSTFDENNSNISNLIDETDNFQSKKKKESSQKISGIDISGIDISSLLSNESDKKGKNGVESFPSLKSTLSSLKSRKSNESDHDLSNILGSSFSKGNSLSSLNAKKEKSDGSLDRLLSGGLNKSSSTSNSETLSSDFVRQKPTAEKRKSESSSMSDSEFKIGSENLNDIISAAISQSSPSMNEKKGHSTDSRQSLKSNKKPETAFSDIISHFSDIESSNKSQHSKRNESSDDLENIIGSLSNSSNEGKDGSRSKETKAKLTPSSLNSEIISGVLSSNSSQHSSNTEKRKNKSNNNKKIDDSSSSGKKKKKEKGFNLNHLSSQEISDIISSSLSQQEPSSPRNKKYVHKSNSSSFVSQANKENGDTDEFSGILGSSFSPAATYSPEIKVPQVKSEKSTDSNDGILSSSFQPDKLSLSPKSEQSIQAPKKESTSNSLSGIMSSTPSKIETSIHDEKNISPQSNQKNQHHDSSDEFSGIMSSSISPKSSAINNEKEDETKKINQKNVKALNKDKKNDSNDNSNDTLDGIMSFSSSSKSPTKSHEENKNDNQSLDFGFSVPESETSGYESEKNVINHSTDVISQSVKSNNETESSIFTGARRMSTGSIGSISTIENYKREDGSSSDKSSLDFLENIISDMDSFDRELAKANNPKKNIVDEKKSKPTKQTQIKKASEDQSSEGISDSSIKIGFESDFESKSSVQVESQIIESDNGSHSHSSFDKESAKANNPKKNNIQENVSKPVKQSQIKKESKGQSSNSINDSSIVIDFDPSDFESKSNVQVESQISDSGFESYSDSKSHNKSDHSSKEKKITEESSSGYINYSSGSKSSSNRKLYNANSETVGQINDISTSIAIEYKSDSSKSKSSSQSSNSKASTESKQTNVETEISSILTIENEYSKSKSSYSKESSNSQDKNIDSKFNESFDSISIATMKDSEKEGSKYSDKSTTSKKDDNSDITQASENIETISKLEAKSSNSYSKSSSKEKSNDNMKGIEEEEEKASSSSLMSDFESSKSFSSSEPPKSEKSSIFLDDFESGLTTATINTNTQSKSKIESDFIEELDDSIKITSTQEEDVKENVEYSVESFHEKSDEQSKISNKSSAKSSHSSEKEKSSVYSSSSEHAQKRKRHKHKLKFERPYAATIRGRHENKVQYQQQTQINFSIPPVKKTKSTAKESVKPPALFEPQLLNSSTLSNVNSLYRESIKGTQNKLKLMNQSLSALISLRRQRDVSIYPDQQDKITLENVYKEVNKKIAERRELREKDPLLEHYSSASEL